MSRVAQLTVAGTVVSLIVLCLYLVLGSRFGSDGSATTKEMALAEPSPCIDGGRDRLEVWGVNGWVRYCEKNWRKHGRWTAWERRKKIVDGHYRADMKYGTWRYYGRDGGKEREEYYYGVGEETTFRFSCGIVEYLFGASSLSRLIIDYDWFEGSGVEQEPMDWYFQFPWKQRPQASIGRHACLPQDFFVEDLTLFGIVRGTHGVRAVVFTPGGVDFWLKEGDFLDGVLFVDGVDALSHKLWRVALINEAGPVIERGVHVELVNPVDDDAHTIRFIPLVKRDETKIALPLIHYPLVGRGCPDPRRFKLHIWTHSAFENGIIDIDIELDGMMTLAIDFDTGIDHNLRTFEFRICPGEHTFKATSMRAEATIEKDLLITDETDHGVLSFVGPSPMRFELGAGEAGFI